MLRKIRQDRASKNNAPVIDSLIVADVIEDLPAVAAALIEQKVAEG